MGTGSWKFGLAISKGRFVHDGFMAVVIKPVGNRPKARRGGSVRCALSSVSFRSFDNRRRPAKSTAQPSSQKEQFACGEQGAEDEFVVPGKPSGQRQP